MPEVASELEQLEQQHADATDLVSKRNMSIRLAQNPDFRKLILEGFCRDDAARLVQESGDPFLNAEQRADALNMAQASGHLKRFLSNTFVMGSHAERTMGDLESSIADARAEEGAE